MHGALHAPQWVLLLLVSTQALPHSIRPATEQPQTPFLHASAPLGQALQPPQWAIVPSPPSGMQAFPVHVIWPVGQTHMQTPLPHTVPLGQPAPHGQPIVPPPPPVPAPEPPIPPGAPAIEPPLVPAAPAPADPLSPPLAPPGAAPAFPPLPAAPLEPAAPVAPAPPSPPSVSSAAAVTSPQPVAATTDSTISLVIVFMRFAP